MRVEYHPLTVSDLNNAVAAARALTWPTAGSPAGATTSSGASTKRPSPTKRQSIEKLPIYPDQRQCRRPTTEQILRLFSLAERHTLLRDGHTVQLFDTELTDLQRQVLTLLGVPLHAYCRQNSRGNSPRTVSSMCGM
jgi:hypothetical protein